MSRSSLPRPPATVSVRSSPKAEASPALVAVEQDASGHALAQALSYAKGIGCTRAGVLETTFTEETETDLFGEQAVLCGGTAALVKAGFETLTEAGYQPELAYFEVLHELKLIVDLMYRGGLEPTCGTPSPIPPSGAITSPALASSPPTSRRPCASLLDDIQDGTFARKFIEENETGRHVFASTRASEAAHPIEKVGADLRAAMPFLDPVKVVDGQVVKA